MKLTVFGATGGTGRLFVQRALAEGHLVTAVVRRPEAMTDSHPALDVLKGDVMARDTLEVHAGCEAVVFLAGAVKGGPHDVYTRGVPNVMAAMRESGVSRLVVVTNGMRSGPADTAIQRIVKILLRNTLLRHVYRDHVRLHELIAGDPLDWTIVRPPRLLDGPARGGYRTAVGDTIPNGFSITRADLAEAVLRVAPDRATVRRTVDVSF
ncbi:NAD(P)H-binding protein [Nonomuraea sp. NBC_01738]|uniref:NAD(P)-dependent oxidoreductase n=1 Tax=Nonomuraea sp. NBC_01738 TaxID=2976003 RepID=UPI002E0FA163|nr:NAD(P)H-binding protein [Nonomuraea sp. NBC_01738]